MYALGSGRIKLSYVLLMSSVLIKFFTFTLFPVFLLAQIRNRNSRGRHIREAAFGIGLAALLAVVAYVPFWEGAQTIGPLRRTGLESTSPISMVHFFLEARGAPPGVSQLVSASAWLLFAVLAFALMLREHRGDGRVSASCFDVLFACLVIANSWFWSWYLISLLAMASVAGDKYRSRLAVVFSASALTKYFVLTFFWYRLGHFQVEALMTLAVFVPPFLYLSGARLIASRSGRKEANNQQGMLPKDSGREPDIETSAL